MLENIQEQLRHKNYYNGSLCNNPQPILGQSEPEVIFYKKYSDANIDYSIVVPVFNQEKIIEINILSIIKHMEGNFEIIIILDSCVDNTESILLNLFKHINISNLIKVIIIKQETPVFETTCDNIGFIISSGKYIIEIQADMNMVEYGFNKNLERGFKKYNDIIGISGRCTHFPGGCQGIGKIGTLIEQPLPIDLDRNLLYMYGTCNRGPLMLDREKLKHMKYLDEQNYFLDGSEHDLFARSYFLNNWKCGYIPIEFKSPLNQGSTRNVNITSEIQDINKKVLMLKEKRAIGGFEKTIRDKYSLIPREIRSL